MDAKTTIHLFPVKIHIKNSHELPLKMSLFAKQRSQSFLWRFQAFFYKDGSSPHKQENNARMPRCQAT
jgi:hypothetical protein